MNRNWAGILSSWFWCSSVQLTRGCLGSLRWYCSYQWLNPVGGSSLAFAFGDPTFGRSVGALEILGFEDADIFGSDEFPSSGALSGAVLDAVKVLVEEITGDPETVFKGVDDIEDPVVLLDTSAFSRLFLVVEGKTGGVVDTVGEEITTDAEVLLGWMDFSLENFKEVDTPGISGF